jgi:hypothetical protein
VAADAFQDGLVVALNESGGPGRLVSVVPTVVSGSGEQGAFFRTRLMLENRCSESMEGRLDFRPRAGSSTGAGATLPFALGPFERRRLEDVVSDMGTSGSGSLDVYVSRGPAPDVRAEVFNSALGGAVRGGVEAAVAVGDVLTSATGGDLIAPADPATHRSAIGLRTFGFGAALRATVRDPLGRVVGVVHRSFGPNRSVQQSARELLGGIVLSGRETVTISMLAGSAIVFSTTADNASSTPRIQVLARPGTLESPPGLAGCRGIASR